MHSEHPQSVVILYSFTSIYNTAAIYIFNKKNVHRGGLLVFSSNGITPLGTSGHIEIPRGIDIFKSMPRDLLGL